MSEQQRDASIDALRAGAIVCIVLGHWAVTGISLTHGVLSVVSPLDYAPSLEPYTFVFQALALFFFAAGYAARASGQTDRPLRRIWDMARGLALPLLILAALWLVFGVTMFLLGMPLTNIPRIGSLLFSPLWFFGVYLMLQALTPVMVWVRDRIGDWILLVCVLLVILGDVNVYAELGQGWTLVTSLIGAWTVPWVLGMWLRDADESGGRRLSALLLFVVGAVVLTLGLKFGPYPTSMVGITGEPHSNLSPPSLVTVALGCCQIAIFLAVRPVVRAVCRWRWFSWVVDLLNRYAIPIYLLHQSALLIPVLISAASIPIPGLISNTFGTFWLVLRLWMIPVFAVILALLIWGLFGGRRDPDDSEDTDDREPQLTGDDLPAPANR